MIPNPAKSKAVEPATPINVKPRLRLFLKMFLKVDLYLNLRCFHMNVMRSKNIFLPFLGGLSLIKLAGFSFKVAPTLIIVTKTTAIIITTDMIEITRKFLAMVSSGKL